MKAIISSVAAAALAAGLAGCGSSGEEQPAESTTSTTVSSSTSSSSSTASSSTLTSPPGAPPSSETQANSTTPAATPAADAPVRPPFMAPEDFDPYGPPRFVQCWESNAAVMSDGSIVTDTVNCAPQPPAAAPTPQYVDPPRADECVGPAATCGYYDEDGNPIW